MQYEEITKNVIGCAFEMSNEMGSGFLESVYENALCPALGQKGLTVETQHPVRVFFRGICVGNFFADVLVEGKVLVELKAVKAIASVHKAQMINYLIATCIDVGLLINFGCPKLEDKRFTQKPSRGQQDIPHA